MSVAHDAVSRSHASGSFSVNQTSFNWTHTPTGTPRGVLILIFGGVSFANPVTSVTYGGVDVPNISASYAADTATEPGFVTAYFLGAGIPTGAQTVVVNRTSSSTTVWAVCSTQTAGADTETAGVVVVQNDGAIAQQSVDDGSTGVDSMRYSGVYYGGATPAPAGANSTLLFSNDAGAYGWTAVRETTAGQGARLVGCTQATSDDRAITALAVREIVIPPPSADFDSVGPSSAGQKAASVTVLSWSHTVGATANLLLVGFAWSGPLATQSATVTFNGVAMTRLATVATNNQTSGYVDVYYLKNPDVGAHTVSVTVPNGGDMEGASVSYIGHDGSVPASVTAFGNSGTSSTGTATANVGTRIVGFFACGSAYASAGGNQRALVNLNTSGGAGNFAVADSTTSASVSAVGGSDWWGAVGVEVKLAAGGTTTVGQSLALSWDVRAALGDTLALSWDIRGIVSDDLVLSWDIRAVVGDSLDTSWDIKAALGDALILSWDVRAAVSDDLVSVWDIRALVNDQVALLWDIHAALGDTLDLSWDIRSIISDDLALSWDIESSVVSVAKELTLLWDIRATIGDPLALSWDARAVIGDVLQALWDIRGVAGRDAVLLWDLRAVLGDTLLVTWDVRSAIGDVLVLSWDVRVVLGDTISLLWDARSLAGQSLALSWDVQSIVLLVNKDLALLWNITGPTGKNLSVVWDTRALLGDSLAITWDIRAMLNDTLELLWDVRSIVGDPLAISWDVRGVAGDDLTLTWHISTLAGQELTIVWDVQSEIPTQHYVLSGQVLERWRTGIDNRSNGVPVRWQRGVLNRWRTEVLDENP